MLLLLLLQGDGWGGRPGRGCRGGQGDPLQMRWPAERSFGNWRTEVRSSAAADLLLLLLLLVDSMVRVWWRGPGCCLLRMSWRWDCPRSSVLRSPGVSLSSPVSCEQGSEGRGSGQGKSRAAASPPETHQLESAHRDTTICNTRFSY